MQLCARLSYWIYLPNTDPLPNKKDFFPPHIVETGGQQVAQWALLISKIANPTRAYLIFKGTDPDKIFDMIVDSGVVPLPLWFDDCIPSDGTMSAKPLVRASDDKKNTKKNVTHQSLSDSVQNGEKRGLGLGKIIQNKLKKSMQIPKEYNGFSVHSGVHVSTNAHVY